jgi:hypothetical protein
MKAALSVVMRTIMPQAWAEDFQGLVKIDSEKI